MTKNFIGVIACIAFLLIGHIANAQSTKDIKAAIEKTNALYFKLFKNKDTTIINLYTSDACLMPPNSPGIRGKAALDKDFKDTYAAGNITGVQFTTANVYGNGGAYITEEGSWQVFDTTGKAIDNGKYLKLWKKTDEGWKIFRDVFNSDRKNQ